MEMGFVESPLSANFHVIQGHPAQHSPLSLAPLVKLSTKGYKKFTIC